MWWRAEVTQQIEAESDAFINANAFFRTFSSVVTSFAESGTVSTDQSSRTEWHTVELNRRYTQPIVIMQPLSHRGSEPSTVRVQNVTNRSFQFKIDEWSYLDGAHISETIHYMVIESGIHTMPNSGGMKLHAGLTDVNHSWSTVSFQEEFTRAPIVLSQVQSVVGGETVITRQRRINRTQFELRLQKSEASNGARSRETVGYLAMMPGETYLGGQAVKAGRTSNSVTHKPKKINFGGDYGEPILLAAMQTFDGPDVAGLRYEELTASSVTLFIEEEQSKDSEMNHTTEVIGYIVIGVNDDPPTVTPIPTSAPLTPTPLTPTPLAPTPLTPTPLTPTATPSQVTPTVTTVPEDQVLFIEESDRERGIYEKNGAQRTTVSVQRQGGTRAINIAFTLLGHVDTTKGSAAPGDYILRGSDGQLLTDSIPFKVGQTIHDITIEAVVDEQIEVPETLRIQLQNGQGMADVYMNVMDSNSDGKISSADSSFSDDAKIREASAALVDLADDYLCTGRLQANATGDLQTDAREIIITGVKDALAFRDGRNATQSTRALDDRIREALYLVASAPHCTYME